MRTYIQTNTNAKTKTKTNRPQAVANLASFMGITIDEAMEWIKQIQEQGKSAKSVFGSMVSANIDWTE